MTGEGSGNSPGEQRLVITKQAHIQPQQFFPTAADIQSARHNPTHRARDRPKSADVASREVQ